MNSSKCASSGCSNKAAPTSVGGFCSFHAIKEGSHFPGSKKTGAAKSPASTKTTTTKTKTSGGGDIFDRLTDTKNYTGVYKERFDEDGKGKGINLVTSHQGQTSLSDMADRTEADVRGLKITDSEENKSAGAASNKPKKCSTSDCKNRASPTSPGGFCSYHASVNKEGSSFPGAKAKAAAKTTTTTSAASSGKKKASGGGGIFDRLTDTKNYTGVHKERFDADGKGKGVNLVTSHQSGTQLNNLLDRSPADVRGRKV
mmetsp:Transcript_49109/g.56458  ORF Transcript_49109/g.56458 Transcript_49109/m.56458 type:complete len:257 (+) Transcript_49109:126-896(+)|eukprot:CAMPEP_0115005564 /NCGR_PEP_ID=MMETSP0216-20121206/19953_1 /TAXON_ID=223996 /ORGANISM="Protocruzia adherens, Strain Boccale" /LENGTH=256 /DNA_ID=CAMNT_0002371927 /DNA_START=62 /DNA_END=832 /DNA_ORIENTATION=+